MSKNRRSPIPGIVCLLLGVWLLLDRMAAFESGLDRIYPFFLLTIAIVLLIEAVWKGRASLFFWSVVVLQIGLFFGLRNFGVLPYFSGEEYWPFFLFAAGLGFFALFLFQPDRWGTLVPAALLLFFGLTASMETFDTVPRALEWLHDHFGPVFLLLSGSVLLIHSAVRKSRT
jgi:hypothetical protein